MSYDVTIRFRRFFSRLQRPVDNFGEQALFYGETMRYVPNAITATGRRRSGWSPR